jgi:hypothetical protein
MKNRIITYTLAGILLGFFTGSSLVAMSAFDEFNFSPEQQQISAKNQPGQTLLTYVKNKTNKDYVIFVNDKPFARIPKNSDQKLNKPISWDIKKGQYFIKLNVYSPENTNNSLIRVKMARVPTFDHDRKTVTGFLANASMKFGSEYGEGWFQGFSAGPLEKDSYVIQLTLDGENLENSIADFIQSKSGTSPYQAQ